MTAPLLSIQQALLLKDEQEIFAQIDIRKKLIKDMVGSLYPSILTEEINKLYVRIRNLREPPSEYQI